MLARFGTALALAALALAGCTGREAAIKSSARPAPTPSVKVTPTLSSGDLGHALRVVAIAQEEHFTDHGTYTAELPASMTSPVDFPSGVFVKVVSATATGYCLSATAEGVTMYLDSDNGRPTWDRCR